MQLMLIVIFLPVEGKQRGKINLPLQEHESEDFSELYMC